MNILKMLKHEEKKMENRLEGLRAAISALNGTGLKVRARVSKLRGRKLSAAHKRAIKAAWAKRRAALAK